MANNLEEAWPDPTYDKAAFDRRLDQYVAQQSAKARDEGNGTMQAMQGYLLDGAVERAEAAVRDHAPFLAEILDHPQFGQHFREVLARTDPSLWSDPRYLASVAGSIAPQLAQRVTGRSSISFQQPRHESGRQQAAEYTDVDRLLAEREGIPLEVAAAADDPTGERLRRARAQQARPRSGRR